MKMIRIHNKIYNAGNKTRIFIRSGLTGRDRKVSFRRVSQMMLGDEVNRVHTEVAGQTLLGYLRDV